MVPPEYVFVLVRVSMPPPERVRPSCAVLFCMTPEKVVFDVPLTVRRYELKFREPGSL